MRYLFIDTASSRRIVSIIENNEVIYNFNDKNGNDLSSAMLPLISEALNSCNLSINDIDTLFVVVGPGSFTGIRVGVTIAKTIGWSLNKRVIPVSELELMASGIRGKCASLIDARRGYVYAGIYDENRNIFDDSYILLKDIINESKKYGDNISFVSYDKFENIDVIEPEVNIVNIIKKHINDEEINPHFINPVYLKNTEAEEKLNING